MTLKKADKGSVNEALTQARRDHEWSQDEVADKIGTTAVSISRWERGIARPGPYFKKKLCELYSKSEVELGLAKEEITVHQEQQVPISSGQKQLSHVLWNIPYKRSPYFTGRENTLEEIHRQLFDSNNNSVVTVAISGLGGVGKTLLAIEYAYQYRSSYTTILWANAETYNTLLSGFAKMADKSVLDLPEKDEQDQTVIVTAVKQWLSAHQNWLLILDNAEDISMACQFIPPVESGHVLLTTRSQAVGDDVDYQIKVGNMTKKEASLFLLKRAKFLQDDILLDEISPSLQESAKTVVEILGYFPLALDQAGAYIEETKCTLSDYLVVYQASHHDLLKRRAKSSSRYRETIATAWAISFEKVTQANPIAAELLHFLAFLHADAIPEEIVTACAQVLGPQLQHLNSILTLNQAIEELLKYSLVNRHSNNQTLSIHRLVQTVIKDTMKKDEQREWAVRVVYAIDKIFPVIKFASLPLCERYILHAFQCVNLIGQWNIQLIEAVHLLGRIAKYLEQRSQFAQAKLLLQRAIIICENIPEHQVGQKAELANSLNGLAGILEIQGNFDEAISLSERTLSIAEKELGPKHPELIHVLNSLALLYIKKHQLEEAEKYIENVTTIIENNKELDQATFIYSLHIRAELYSSKGKYAEAESLYKQAISMRAQLLGPEHPDLVSLLNNLAVLYMDQGRFLAAEPLFRQGLAILEVSWGMGHYVLAFHLINIAVIQVQQGKLTEAEELYQRALIILEETLGTEHDEVVGTLTRLGQIYRQQEKFEVAEQLLQKAVLITQAIHGLEHPSVACQLTILAGLYLQQGKNDRVEELYQRVLAMLKDTSEPEHPDVLHCLNNLASLSSTQEKWIQAESLYKKALAIAEKILGPEHGDTVRVQLRYVNLLKKMGREEEALKLEEYIRTLIQEKYLNHANT